MFLVKYHPKQSGFAMTISSNQTDPFSGVYGKTDIIEDKLASVCLF
jgi:hypothetical protein